MNRRLLLVASVVAGALACAAPKAPAGERLYFALELRRDGQLVGRPQLLGESGHRVVASRQQPGASTPDYQLVLKPTGHPGDRYRISLDVDVPGCHGHSELELLHAEEKRLRLASDLEVTLLVMRVNSPEFKTLMELAARRPGPLAI